MGHIKKARKVVDDLRETAMESDGAIEGIAKNRLVDKIQEIVRLKEERIAIIEGEAEYDLDRLLEIAGRQDELIADLKGHGVPYHPVMGSKQDYEAAE